MKKLIAKMLYPLFEELMDMYNKKHDSKLSTLADKFQEQIDAAELGARISLDLAKAAMKNIE